MSTPTIERASTASQQPLTHGVLPRYASIAVLAGSVVLATLVMLPFSLNLYGIAFLAFVFNLIGITVTSRVVEGGRKSVDRLVTALVYSAFALAMVPLVSLIWTVLKEGAPGITAEFLTDTQRGVVGEGGGIFHALIGTLLITAFTAIISVPVGIMTAVYLVEYGTGRLARAITFLVDVMTGIPSIVAGLFAYALFVLFFGPGIRLGSAGSVALAVLMIPVVVRATEEMLKLVPNELREASYALGIPKWRTIVKVVIPTAAAGIATGVTLAVARVIGETAPLLIVAGATDDTNWNLFDGRMATLPVFAYYSYVTPGFPPESGIQQAWSAALVLIVLVMVLNGFARLISKLFAPSTG